MTAPISTFYHAGELHLQAVTGKLEQGERISSMAIRDHLIDQHREFFSGLNYLLLGTVDVTALPEASIVAGPVGFLSSPDAKTLRIDTTHYVVDPAIAALAVGSVVGVLGIDLSNRRRNRMHGRVSSVSAEFVDIAVVQSYGNCPKYINTRVMDEQSTTDGSDRVAPELGSSLSTEDVSLIGRSGAFFIASAHSDGTGADYEGADVSHRGGHAGFVQVADENTLNIPDYVGNYLFNTLGNLLLNSKVGLLFVDFENGDLLKLSGSAVIIDTPSLVEQFKGAQRVLGITIDKTARTPGAMPFRGQFVESSMYNPKLESSAAGS